MEKSRIAAAVTASGESAPEEIGACEGFSLIELLVVVLTLGVLASVAIPTFLSQRELAIESAVQADLRNAGTFQVAQLQSGEDPAANLGELLDLGFRSSNGVDIVDADFLAGETEFCIEGRAANGTGRTWAVSSDDGLHVVVDEGC